MSLTLIPTTVPHCCSEAQHTTLTLTKHAFTPITVTANVVTQVATSPLGTGMFKILMDSTDCSITNNSTVAAHTGSVLIADRSVQAGGLLDWRFYGAVVPIPAGVHTLTLCATGGDLNVDYLKFKVST
jgi:hypothetical protein